MSANVESMFYVREAPWHGLGIRVDSVLNSEDALEMSGLEMKILDAARRQIGIVFPADGKGNQRVWHMI